MKTGHPELLATASGIATLASEAPPQELPGAQAAAVLALSGATLVGVMGSPASASEVRIAQGDTLSEIADRYDTTTKKLAEQNGIENEDLIVAGKSLKVPEETKPAVVIADGGESPWSIAKTLLGQDSAPSEVKTLADTIIAHNNIEVHGRRAIVQDGTELEVPGFATRKINKGETATEISKSSNVNPDSLRDEEGAELVDLNHIIAGEDLILPVATVAEVVSEPATVETPAPEAETPVPAVENPAPEVETAPVNNYEAITSINGVDKNLIQDVTKYLIEKHGLTPKGAAYLTGNFIQESALNPNAIGDSGTAKGIAQWRFERLNGMPQGDLYGQIDFALDIEMDRDGIASDLNELLKDPQATDVQLRNGLKRWERWGHQGERFEFAEQLLSQLQTAPVSPTPPAAAAKKDVPEAPVANNQEESNPLNHPLINKESRRTAPGRNGETIDIVEVAGEYVHVDIAVNVANMLEHAKNDGFNIGITSAWRDIKEQEQLRVDNDCPGVYEGRPSECRVPTAIPGTSMHNGGKAVDLNTAGDSIDNATFNWLQQHAGSYGLKNLPSEPWHWSVNGK